MRYVLWRSFTSTLGDKVITVSNRHETETVSWSSDPVTAVEELINYLRGVASDDYQERVLTWWTDDPTQPFVTNNTIGVLPEIDPEADTWTWRPQSAVQAA